LEKAIHHIDSRPDFSLGTVIQDVVNPGQRVRVCDGVLVELMIVINPTWQIEGSDLGIMNAGEACGEEEG
jgi:hypothetical protein